MTLDKKELKEVNDLAWRVILEGLSKEGGRVLSKNHKNVWSIESRTKIKSLVEGLRQFDEPENAVLHFIKFAEYTLPRSNLHSTQIELIRAVNDIQKNTDDPEKLKEKIHYLLGYINWSLETYINVLNNSGNDFDRNMKLVIETEARVMGDTSGNEAIVSGLSEWMRRSDNRGGR